MSADLNATLAIARRQFEELLRLISRDDLIALKLGSGAKRQQVSSLLESLDHILSKIDIQFARQITARNEELITQLGAPHIAFYREHLEPNAKLIRRAYWESTGNRELFEELDEFLEDRKPGTTQPIRSAISWGLERWFDMLTPDELEDWSSRGFAIAGAIDLIEIPVFQPDRWLENMQLLRPLLVDRPVQKLRNHVRLRLTEIYRAFTYGLWMSSIALCRSLLEYSLKENAPRLGISVTYVGSRGTAEDKTLMQLSDEIRKLIPMAGEHLDSVRETGNRILHPKKHDVIAFPHVMREEALECIRATRIAVEWLYLKAGT